MKILQVHNEYRYSGGEEVVVNAEYSMLTEYGHEVSQWLQSNSSLEKLPAPEKLRTSLESIWSYRSYKIALEKIQAFSPDLVHVHNTIPLISPSIYSACKKLDIPVVQTLHNYKFICPGSNLYRDEKICEQCLGKPVPYPALLHGCYRQDYLSTAFLVAGTAFNKIRGTYQQEIDRYVALSDFAKQKMIEGGLPADKITVKPNFIDSDVKVGQHSGNYALYVGRLIPQKGFHTLLKSWSLLEETIPLKVVGQGALEERCAEASSNNIEYLGHLPRESVIKLMQDATLLIFPTEWYEVFGLVLIEAFSTGLPVIASRIGGVSEIVGEGESGWLFNPGEADDLAQVVQSVWQDKSEIQRRGLIARQQFQKHFTREKNYQITMEMYRDVIASRDKIKP